MQGIRLTSSVKTSSVKYRGNSGRDTDIGNGKICYSKRAGRLLYLSCASSIIHNCGVQSRAVIIPLYRYYKTCNWQVEVRRYHRTIHVIDFIRPKHRLIIRR